MAVGKNDFEMWIVAFNKGDNDLTKGRHHGLVIKHPIDSKLVYLFPLTTKVNKFNQKNPYFIEVSGGDVKRYVNLSKMEVRSVNDKDFLEETVSRLTYEDKSKIKEVFQNMIESTIQRLNREIFEKYPEDFIVHRLNENIYKQNEVVGQRTIDAVLIYSQETDHIPGNPNINHYYKLNSKGVEAGSVSTSFFRSSDTTKLTKEMTYKQYQDAFTVPKTKKQNIQI